MLQGDDLGKHFALKIKGEREWASRPMAIARGAFRRDDGPFSAFSCDGPTGDGVSRAVDDDKKEKARAVEFMLRRARQTLIAVTGKQFFADKPAGTFSLGWAPFAKLAVHPDRGVDIPWKQKGVDHLAISTAEISVALRSELTEEAPELCL